MFSLRGQRTLIVRVANLCSIIEACALAKARNLIGAIHEIDGGYSITA